MSRNQPFSNLHIEHGLLSRVRGRVHLIEFEEDIIFDLMCPLKGHIPLNQVVVNHIDCNDKSLLIVSEFLVESIIFLLERNNNG